MKTVLLVIVGTVLLAVASGCEVSPSGPAVPGSIHGVQGTSATYFYKKTAGWTYVYSNVEHLYGQTDQIENTLTAANDTVVTMGYAGLSSPDGDSLFKVDHIYRVLSSYSAGNEIDEYYTSSGFVPSTVTGATSMYKKPRPVSTDTILAGLVGKVREESDDFTNSGSYTWKHDTIFYAIKSNGEVDIWELVGITWVKSRKVFAPDPSNSESWAYDVINGASATVTYTLNNDNHTAIVGAGTYTGCMQIGVSNSEIGTSWYTATKDYATGVGQVYEYDSWRESNDGVVYLKRDFTRSLISLTN